jgi:subtilisin-like proprotein convertase family protein
MIRKLLFVLCIISATNFSLAQNKAQYWAPHDGRVDNPRVLDFQVNSAEYFALDIDALSRDLTRAGSIHDENGQPVTIVIPTISGLKPFQVYEAGDMEAALQTKYPSIRSYKGVSVDNSGDRIRMTITPYGFYASVESFEHGRQYIDPINKSGDVHMLYSRGNVIGDAIESCGFDNNSITVDQLSANGIEDANDSQLRTYRIAISTTVEYSRFQYLNAGLTDASPDVDRRNAVMAAIGVTLARVNQIYERDLAIQMILVANNDQIVFLDTDNFSNNNPVALLSENQAAIDSIIGSSNYDIGHVFSTGGGGIASFASVCNGSRKAQGVTGSPSPIGDPYDIDFVAHEIGHQFGASHSYNGDAAACGGQRSASTAYEVGSGTTIMAYAGICPPQNVQPNSDAYFHQISLDQIFNFVSNSARCSNELTIANDPPTADAGPDYFIPISTPYKLTGSSTDPQGTSLHTYTWEQYDLGTAGTPDSRSTNGPLVRSREGTSSPTRIIPKLSDILANGGTSTEWEVLPAVTRAINYRLTVRDNDARGGQSASDQAQLISQVSAGPFTVTSQNTSGITWLPNTTETITWSVANTNAAPINTSTVNILLSSDGGQTFDTVLAANTPNDGSEAITVPSNIVSIDCRIMIEAVNNVFFNVNTERFAVNAREEVVCDSFSSGVVNTVIPDSPGTNVQGAPAFVPVQVTTTSQPDFVRVTTDVTHPYNGDLILQLQSPTSGQFSNIWARDCNATQNANIQFTFEDGAPAIACGNTSTGSGPYNPSNPLSVFNGSNPSGTWNLVGVDFFQGDTGTINSWSIEICTTRVVPLSTESFVNADFNIYPNPSNGQITIESPLFEQNNFQIRLFDISGKQITTQELAKRKSNILDFSNLLSSGIYLLQIESESTSSVHKLVIE